jgi:hypothetical protein
MKPRTDEGRPVFRLGNVPAASLRVGVMTVTPVAKSLVAGWKGLIFVWTRPHSVLVSRDGRISRSRIFNLTRAAQLSIVGLAVLGAFLISTRSSGNKEMST